MATRLSGRMSIFGGVFFVSKSLLGIVNEKKLEKFALLIRKPWIHVRILRDRTWRIGTKLIFTNAVEMLGKNALHEIIQIGFPANCEFIVSILHLATLYFNR